MKRSFCLILLSLAALSAQATALRTFVASTGLDTNPCSRTSPCRSFAAALVETAPSGEIIVLDSAGYGPVTIGQSVSIISPASVYAGVTATSGDGIMISGTGQSDIVVLHGLTINGGGTGSVGVWAGDGTTSIAIGEVHVESCNIAGFSNGIVVSPNSDSYLFVSDTLVRGIGTYGVIASPTGIGTARVAVDRLRAERIGFTAVAFFGTQAMGTVANSLFGGNSNAIYAQGGTIDVDHCTIVQNMLGISAAMNGSVRVSNTVIVSNGIGLSGSSVLTRITGDPVNPVKTNTLTGNTTNGSFGGTFTAQ